MYNEDGRNGGATVVSYGGIGFTGILQVVFIILKLCGVINWHWALVMLPMIISCGLPIVIALIMLIIYGILRLVEKHNRDL